jgi:hypothetical protein
MTPRRRRFEITPAEVSLAPRERVTLQARVSAGGGELTWMSSDTAVATVAAGGLVEAVAPGTTTVRATLAAASAETAVIVRAGPAARWAYGLAYDETRRQVVLFGGSKRRFPRRHLAVGRRDLAARRGRRSDAARPADPDRRCRARARGALRRP